MGLALGLIYLSLRKEEPQAVIGAIILSLGFFYLIYNGLFISNFQ